MLLDDIADYLTSQGGSGVGTVYAGGFPPTALDNAVAVYEYPGMASVHHMNSEPGQAIVERPRVQVVARGASEAYQSARTRAHNVFVLLDGLRDRTINGTRYLWVAAIQPPFLLDADDNKRVRIA